MNSDSDPHWSHSALPKIVNILAYIFFTGTHAYFVWNGTYADGASKLTYITPAPWVLLIWPVIHLLLLGSIIYQFTENGRRIVVEGISWRFLVVMEVTALYLYLWHIHEYVLAFLVAIVNSFLVSDIYEILDEIQLQYTTPIPASIFVYIPFSLYYAWTSVLIFLSGFAAFGVDAATQPAGTYTKICVFLTLFYLQSSTAGGIYGWLTIVWYLWGVFVYQRNSGFVHESALVFAVLASVWVGEALINGIMSYWWRGERGGVGDEERAPLLG